MESFTELAEQYEAMIWKIIRSLHIYKNQEDYFQIGLIALWDASNRFVEGKGSFTSFAYAYIKGRIQTELTSSSKHESRNVYPKEEFWEVIKDESPDRALETEFIQSYCKSLTDNQQKWVMYTALDFLSVREIAEKEHVSVSAVKAWRKGAREKLKGQLEFRD